MTPITLDTLHRVVVSAVRSDAPDLSQRQLAVLLDAARQPEPRTVRGLAAALNVSKPAITRALDRLEELALARRIPDPQDGRSVLVSVTRAGREHLARLVSPGEVLQ